jgi:antitoxin ParD1/3/4
MEVTISETLESFVKQAVSEGRFSSESEVVNLGLRLVQENDRKLLDLRTMINASIEAGGLVTAEEMDQVLQEQEEEPIARGFPE